MVAAACAHTSARRKQDTRRGGMGTSNRERGRPGGHDPASPSVGCGQPRDAGIESVQPEGIVRTARRGVVLLGPANLAAINPFVRGVARLRSACSRLPRRTAAARARKRALTGLRSGVRSNARSSPIIRGKGTRMSASPVLGRRTLIASLRTLLQGMQSPVYLRGMPLNAS